MLTAPRLTAALAVLMGSLALASPAPLDLDKRQSATCAPVHLFVARGTTEPPGDGSIGSLAQLVLRANPGATKESIDYPASSDPTYIDDVTIGIEAVIEQVTSYVSACPNSTLVLIGYSQGAQIILDALCGSGGPELGGTGEPTISPEQGAKIAAIVGYGDPGRVNGETWNQGTATRNGVSYTNTLFDWDEDLSC
ncbi:cutinase-domain-containing protein [Aspergillus keveii]|uniref:Cutinase-domain-containing protein n=1 Tax=Aspergillus keveii TaxID=714993 RepID=A0ABR4G6F0_9EURO